MDTTYVGNAIDGSLRDQRLVLGVITNTPMFRDATQRQQGEIASHSKLHNIRRGTLICRQGEPMPGLLLVAYGMLKLALCRPDGEERVVRFVGPNEAFGEAPALLERPSPFDAAALTDSMLVVIPRAPVMRLLELHPGFAHNIVANLAEGYLALLAELQASVQWRGVRRLASYLESLAEPGQSPGGCRVRLPASKTAVAARLGVKKETLSRMLRDLTERGCIRVERREIAILDRARLAELAA